MKMMKIMSYIACFSLLGAPAFAKRGGHGKHFEKIMSKLDLTDVQKKEMKAFKKDNRGTMKGYKKSIKALKDQLEEGFAANASDKTLQGLHNEISGLHAKMGDIKFKKLIFLKGMLNEEQRKKFMKLKKRHKKKPRR